MNKLPPNPIKACSYLLLVCLTFIPLEQSLAANIMPSGDKRQYYNWQVEEGMFLQDLALQTSHFTSLPSHHYTIQALSTHSRLEAQAFIDNLPVIEWPYYLVQLPEENWVILVGDFASLEEAQEAATQMPTEIKKLQYWYPQVGMFQQQLFRATELNNPMPAHKIGFQPRSAISIDSQEIDLGAAAEFKDKEYLLVGLIDMEAGQRQITGNLDTATSGDRRYADSMWKDGKVQVHFKGMIKGEYLLTASIDSERGRDIWSRNIDINHTYAVYGDSALVSNLANDSDGPLYILVEKDDSWAKWGRINPNIRAHLASFQRSLQGAQGHYESLEIDAYGNAKTEIDIFDARVSQKKGRIEFNSPVGSLFYLKHNEVVADSINIQLETRDKVSGNVISTRTLVEETDYEVNAPAGRIMLNEPLLEPEKNKSLITDEEEEDYNPVYLLVDYNYVIIDDWNKGISGGVISHSLNKKLRVGMVTIKEDQSDGVYELDSIEATAFLDDDNKHKLDIAYAESASEVEPKYVSTDGGLTWQKSDVSMTNEDTSNQGAAFSVRGQYLTPNERVKLNYYYRDKEPGFSAQTSSSQQGWEAIGQNISAQINEQIDLHLQYHHQWRKDLDNLQTKKTAEPISSRMTRLQVNNQITERLDISTELRHRQSTQADTTNKIHIDDESNIVAIQGRYQISEDTEIALKQQQTLKGKDTSHTAVDFRYRASSNLIIKSGATHGPQGSAGFGDIEYKVRDRVTLQSDLKYGTDDRLASSLGVGYAGDKLSLHGGIKHKSDQRLSSSVGVGYKRDKFNVEGGLERESDQPLSSSVGVGYTGDKLSVKSGLKHGADQRLTTSVGLNYRPEDGQGYRVGVSDGRGGEKHNSQSLTLGTNRDLSPNTEVEVSTTMTLKGEHLRQDQMGSIKHQIDEERSLSVGISNYEQESEGEQSDGYDFKVGYEPNRHWAIDVSAGQGYVHRLEGGKDKRQNASVGAAYVRQDTQEKSILRGLIRYEMAQETGQKNRDRHLLQTGLKGKYNQDITLFTDLDLGYTKDRDQEKIEARNNQFDFGFAYRPVLHDRLNLIGKYSWLDEQKPADQTSYTGLEILKGHVMSADILYDITNKWSLGGKVAIRKAQEKMPGLPITEAVTSLGAINNRYYFLPETWLSGEYRLLSTSLTKDSKEGLVVELGKRFNDHIDAAVGYNWAGYNADLTALEYGIEGVYVRLSIIME